MRTSSGTFSQCVRRMSQGWARRPCHRSCRSVASMDCSFAVRRSGAAARQPPLRSRMGSRQHPTTLTRPLLLHLHGLASLHHLPVHHHHLAILHVHFLAVFHLHHAVFHHLGAIRHAHIVVHRPRGLPVHHHHHLAILHHDATHLGGHEPGGKERRTQQHDSGKGDYAILSHE